jgi:hypothetical protein
MIPNSRDRPVVTDLLAIQTLFLQPTGLKARVTSWVNMQGGARSPGHDWVQEAAGNRIPAPATLGQQIRPLRR